MQPVAQIDWRHPKSLGEDDLVSQLKQKVHQAHERKSNVVADLQQYPKKVHLKFESYYKGYRIFKKQKTHVTIFTSEHNMGSFRPSLLGWNNWGFT